MILYETCKFLSHTIKNIIRMEHRKRSNLRTTLSTQVDRVDRPSSKNPTYLNKCKTLNINFFFIFNRF